MACIFLTGYASTGFSQSRHSDIYILELFNAQSSPLKVHKLKKTELKKMSNIKNYIIVKKPSEDMVYFWEIPAVTQASLKPDKQKDEKEIEKETQKPQTIENKNLFELAKQLGIGEAKNGSSH